MRIGLSSLALPNPALATLSSLLSAGLIRVVKTLQISSRLRCRLRAVCFDPVSFFRTDPLSCTARMVRRVYRRNYIGGADRRHVNKGVCEYFLRLRPCRSLSATRARARWTNV